MQVNSPAGSYYYSCLHPSKNTLSKKPITNKEILNFHIPCPILYFSERPHYNNPISFVNIKS
jgi:hypothetical protein